MCHYGTPGCVDQTDNSHECRPAPAPLATPYHHPTLAELQEALDRAQEALHRECRSYLDARAAVKAAEDAALEAAVRWGQTWRQAASARKALIREREAIEMLGRVIGRPAPLDAHSLGAK